MSLIPSESSSFADLLGRGLDGSKKSKWREHVAEPPKLSGPPKPSPRLPAKSEKPQAQRAKEKSQKTVAVVARAADKESAIARDPLAVLLDFSQSAATPIPEEIQPLPPLREAIPQMIEPPPPAAPDPLAVFFDFSQPAPTLTPEQIQPLSPAPPPEAIPQTIDSAPAQDPLSVLLGLFPSSVVQAPEAVEPFQDEAVSPPQWVPEQPIRKAPLVIQPEDEPPRRPIPIVRVVRSKQNPNGNGREHLPQTNGHDISAPEPQVQPQPQPTVPEAFAEAGPAGPALLTIPRPRPRPLVRPRVEEESQALQPSPAAPLPEPEPPQKVWPKGPMAALAKPARIERAQPPRLKFDESAWLAVRMGGRNFEFRWRGRFARFMTCEAIAILVLITAVVIGMGHRTVDDPVNMITRILAISAAVAAAIVPVLFYGLPERFPRDAR